MEWTWSAAVLFFFIGQTFCQPLTPEEEESIETLIEGVRSCRGIPGVSVAAVRGNEVVLAEGYGEADIELGLPVTSETLFGIASISKQFTGILLSKIRSEQGYVTSLASVWNLILLKSDDFLLLLQNFPQAIPRK